MKYCSELFRKLKNNKKTLFILAAIFIVGFILRSYHFSDWLRFNADQARDAKLASNFVEHPIALNFPFVGPKAGGTEFALGPIFYYFQVAAMEIFGTDPAVASYPDLLFSLLSIPLFYFLSRALWNPKISLALTWLFTISYFVIKYSRFAWNPNSTAFFVMLFLYSFYRIIISSGHSKLWLVVSGVALGVLVQLHTSLLIIMPLITIFSIVYLWKKQKIKMAAATVIILTSLVVNAGQVTDLFTTHGRNISLFFQGAANKNQRNVSLEKNVLQNAFCHINANSHILTSLGNEDNCGYGTNLELFNLMHKKRTPLLDATGIGLWLFLAIIFSASGYFLFFRLAKKEKDENRKIFLVIFSVYVSMIFLFFILWAQELSIRFFLPVSFVPFFLLGAGFEFFYQKTKIGNAILFLVIILATFLNSQKIYATYHDLQYGGREINNSFDYITLGEVEYISNFIKDNSPEEKTVYIDGQALYLFKSINSFDLVMEKYGIKPIEFRKRIVLEPGARLYYLKSAKNNCQFPDDLSERYTMEKCLNFRQFSVFALNVK